MTTYEKSITIKGSMVDMDMAIVTGCKYASSKKLDKDGSMTITWICESNEDVHDLADIVKIQEWNCDVTAVKN